MKKTILTTIVLSLNLIASNDNFVPQEFLDEHKTNPEGIHIAEAKNHDIFTSLPDEIKQEIQEQFNLYRENVGDSREWYQKKRYWALIATGVAAGGAAGGAGAAKVAVLLNASQTTIGIAAGTTGAVTGVAAGAITYKAIEYCHKGYKIKIVSNGVYITKMEEAE
jgi:hypothetical protein